MKNDSRLRALGRALGSKWKRNDSRPLMKNYSWSRALGFKWKRNDSG